jgi:hypothetical protein
MRTAPEFAANPIGVVFDADLVLAVHEDGVLFDQIREHSYAVKYPPKTKPGLLHSCVSCQSMTIVFYLWNNIAARTLLYP